MRGQFVRSLARFIDSCERGSYRYSEAQDAGDDVVVVGRRWSWSVRGKGGTGSSETRRTGALNRFRWNCQLQHRNSEVWLWNDRRNWRRHRLSGRGNITWRADIRTQVCEEKGKVIFFWVHLLGEGRSVGTGEIDDVVRGTQGSAGVNLGQGNGVCLLRASNWTVEILLLAVC